MMAKSLMVLVALATALPAAAVEVADLYRAQTLVTGIFEPERTRGFRIGVTDVVIKLTGDARLEGSPLLAPLLDDPHPFVAAHEYEDRMKDLPIGDEQGTRDRPYFLRMQFDRAKIDAALRDLGLKKWSSDRPLLAVWLAVQTAAGKYVLHATGEQGYGQRAVLEDTSARRGVPVWIPPADASTSEIDYEAVRNGSVRALAAASPGTDALLFGTLDLVPATGYWNIHWTFQWGEHHDSWVLENVSFDIALRDGLQQAALIFSRAKP